MTMTMTRSMGAAPAARKLFRECVALANDDRDVDLYHWSSTRFSRAWFDSLSVRAGRRTWVLQVSKSESINPTVASASQRVARFRKLYDFVVIRFVRAN